MSKSGARLKDGKTLVVWDWWSAVSPIGQLTERGRVRWERGPAEGAWNLMVSSANELFGDGSLEMAAGGELVFYQTVGGDWFVRAIADLPGGEKVDTLFPVSQMGEMATWGMASGDAEVNNHLFKADGKLMGLTVLNDGRYATWKVVESSGKIPSAL